MKNLGRQVALYVATGPTLLMAACGGGSSSGGGNNPPPVTPPAVSSVAVTPNPAATVIGTTLQFSAAVTGPAVTDSTVTWSISAPTGSTLSPGTMTKTGLYTSPYPAPATVTVTATSNQDTTVSGAVTMTLNAPATVAGPALTVDAGNPS